MKRKMRVVLIFKAPLRKKLVKQSLENNFEVEELLNLKNLIPYKFDAAVIEENTFNDISQKDLEKILGIPVIVIVGKSTKKVHNYFDKTNNRLIFVQDKRENLERISRKINILLRKIKKEHTESKEQGEKKQEFNHKEETLMNKKTKENGKRYSNKLELPYKLILVGSSTGGPGLIEQIARSLPKSYPHALCVIQHMPKGFTKKFADRLNSVSELEVVEAEDNTEVVPGRLIIAKSGYHLHFNRKINKLLCKLVPNTKGLFFVPSVNETFFSALQIVNPKNIVAVLLTGIGDDGAEGMVALKRAGALTIAESEESAAVYGMPKEAKEKGGAVKILHFKDILKELEKLSKIN